MNLEELKAPFPADEIEWRIGQSGKMNSGDVWARPLAYVQARAIMNRLDAVCGPAGWRVSYRFIPAGQDMDPGVIAELSIKCGDTWVTKEDGAEQTDIESFKGGISAALKRAGSAWGIGRYLYGLPADYAQIVDRKKPGAKWAKTKDGSEFFWLPPELPAWALPSGSPATAPPVPRSGQPGPEDGNTDSGYRIPFGQWRARSIEDVYNTFGPKKIADYLQYLEDTAKKKNQPLGAQALEFIEMAGAYLGAMENQAVERMKA